MGGRRALRWSVGVISDTHRLLRPEAIELLRGSDLILHAGDVGSPEVLERLAELAPVRAVRGNIDRAPWAEALPKEEEVKLGAHRLLIIHDLKELDRDPAEAGYAAVISGHSHMPRVERRGGVLYLNPGSAGPRRFRLPIALARLHVRGRTLTPEIHEIPWR